MKRTVSTVLMTFLLFGTPFIVFATPVAANPGSYSISVGYADDLRPSAFFPSPWCGDASVALFAGSCSNIDSGAIMITNTGASSIVISDLSINLHPAIGSPTYALWASFLPFTLPAGMSAIFVQTTQYNLDSSDFPLSGIGPSATDNCSTGPESSLAICTSNQPAVSATVDGVTTTYNDVGHTLDTGGFDAVNAVPCPNPADPSGSCNESLQWRNISLSCGLSCPGGGTGVPEFPVSSISTIVIAAFGLLALALVRKTIAPRRFIPGPKGNT